MKRHKGAPIPFSLEYETCKCVASSLSWEERERLLVDLYEDNRREVIRYIKERLLERCPKEHADAIHHIQTMRVYRDHYANHDGCETALDVYFDDGVIGEAKSRRVMIGPDAHETVSKVNLFDLPGPVSKSPCPTETLDAYRSFLEFINAADLPFDIERFIDLHLRPKNLVQTMNRRRRGGKGVSWLKEPYVTLFRSSPYYDPPVRITFDREAIRAFYLNDDESDMQDVHQRFVDYFGDDDDGEWTLGAPSFEQADELLRRDILGPRWGVKGDHWLRRMVNGGMAAVTERL